jgi:hypothetical protein
MSSFDAGVGYPPRMLLRLAWAFLRHPFMRSALYNPSRRYARWQVSACASLVAGFFIPRSSLFIASFEVRN